jgi:hypothetical protein
MRMVTAWIVLIAITTMKKEIQVLFPALNVICLRAVKKRMFLNIRTPCIPSASVVTRNMVAALMNVLIVMSYEYNEQ